MIRNFVLKDGKKLQLTEASITHITEGNFSTRPIGNKKTMIVLSGGLHTYDAWIKFKKNYTDEIEHLHFFNSKKHKYWYYARELGNGVITLRLPRELFTRSAAGITMYPDDYYKSGYLWKTLFPKGYDREKVINSIEEALLNEDIKQRKPGQIVGYTNNEDPLLKIKIVIQHHGKDIKSAFPAWTQPNSGNNGKPFSHYENIGFVIAQSTEYFDDKKKIMKPVSFNFAGTPIHPEELHIHTPKIFTKRNKPEKNTPPRQRKEERINELKHTTVENKENDLIFNYLNDFSLIKHYPELISGAYEYAFDEISNNTHLFNTFQIIQNIIDGLDYLYLTNQIDRLTTTIIHLLENMVSHTLLDLLLKKRLTSKIIEIVESANTPELSYKFLIAISKSPIRREAYMEYNIDSLNKKRLIKKLPLESFPDELILVLNPSLDISIEYEDFVEILKDIIGETYTLNFRGNYLDRILENILSNQSKNFKYLVSDSLCYFCRDDFLYLSEAIGVISSSALEYAEGNRELLATCIGLILRDYCRIQYAHRQRINARYIEHHEYANEFYLPIDLELLLGVILKHERWINYLNLERFTKKISEFARKTSDKGLENDAKNFFEKLGKETPPLPER